MSFSIFFIINMLFNIALHGTRPIVSLFAESLGGTTVIIGLLVSTYAFFSMLIALWIGKWLDQFGSRFVIVIGGVGMLLALFIPIFSPSLVSLFLSQAFMGFSQVCTAISLQKTVGNIPRARDKMIATLSLTAAIGELLGPLITGFSYDYLGFRASFAIPSLIAASALCVSVVLKRDLWNTISGESRKNQKDISSAWQMLRKANLRKALIISGMVLYSKDLFIAYFPIYVSGLGMTSSHIGVLLSLMAGMTIIVRLIQFRLVQLFGRGSVLMTTLIISGIAFILIPFTSLPVFLACLAMFIGAGLGLGQPLSLVYTLNVSPAERQGEILGMRLSFNRGSQFVAPFLFGGIGGIAGAGSIFWLSGIVLLGASYFTRISESSQNEKPVQ